MFSQCEAEVGYFKDTNTLSLLEGMRASLCGTATVRTQERGSSDAHLDLRWTLASGHSWPDMASPEEGQPTLPKFNSHL